MKNSIIILTLLTTIFMVGLLNAEENLEKQFETRYQAWKELFPYPIPFSHAGPLFTCSEFKEIIDLGLPALPYIAKKMEQDSTEGLLWKAIEVIAKFKIYREYDKENNKTVFPDFPELKPGDNIYLYWWQQGYKQTPDMFDELYSKWKQLKPANNEESEKIYQRMINLGIPVVPHMISKLEDGESDFVAAISQLTDGEIKNDASPKECKRWWNNSKEKWTIKFDDSEAKDDQEYKQDYKRVADMDPYKFQSDRRDINAYEEFADRIDQKWRGRNKEYHARLMLDICNPLSSGAFKEKERYDLTRKYALSALVEPDSIPLILELELIGRVGIFVFGPGATSGDDLVEKRAENAAIRLHAWRRLLEAIDPNWDPDDMPVGNISPPVATGLPSGIDPAAIQDPALRAEYEEAIRSNGQKAQKYNEQYKYSKWLRRIPNRVENNIIREYSHPPYAIEELRKMLDDQIPDQEAKARIIEAVEKNMREPQEGTQ